MKCSNCNHYVIDVYNGCTWCKMPKEVKQQMQDLDTITEMSRSLANKQRSWLGYETIIKEASELRISVYDNYIKSLNKETVK